jgi:hypothetical protein
MIQVMYTCVNLELDWIIFRATFLPPIWSPCCCYILTHLNSFWLSSSTSSGWHAAWRRVATLSKSFRLLGKCCHLHIFILFIFCCCLLIVCQSKKTSKSAHIEQKMTKCFFSADKLTIKTRWPMTTDPFIYWYNTYIFSIPMSAKSCGSMYIHIWYHTCAFWTLSPAHLSLSLRCNPGLNSLSITT